MQSLVAIEADPTIRLTRCSRDWARDTKGITEPEMVVPVSAHAAFEKAADYFRIKLRPVPVDPLSRKVDLRMVKRALNPNTIWWATSFSPIGN